MSCRTPDCSRPTRNGEAFCRECFRLVSDDHRQHLRMTYRSPMYGPGSWPYIDGTERMTVKWGDPPEMHAVKGVKPICDVLHQLEFNMALRAVGAEVRKKLARKAARARLAARGRP